MTSQFSPKVSQILAFSREEAARLASRSVGPEHLLLGILRDKTGPVHELFVKSDINFQTIKDELEQKVREEDFAQPLRTHELVLNEKASNILKLAVLEARIQSTQMVDEQHLFLAILHDHVNNGAKEVLEFNNMNYEDALTYFQRKASQTQNGIGIPDKEEDEDDGMLSINGGNSQKSRQHNSQNTATSVHRPTGKTPVLDNFGTDLTKAAAEGKLDPVVGREREIQRVTEILCRRKKNNPILIGEPGVGKSAIVEGLAQLICKHRTSPVLFNKRIVNLDMAAVVAGTKYRGQFEERIRALIKEIEQNPDVIIFIDEIHTLIGAGSTPGSMDAANILKPALARGTIQCIGATTLDEYRNSIEKDGALERRFQKVMVEPTTAQETIEILNNIKDRYEYHHHVSYSEDAILACVKLTERYVTDRAFPDKAIDALDEVGARVHLQHAQMPPEIDEKEKEISYVKEKKQAAVRNQNFELAASYRDKQTELEAELIELQEKWTNNEIGARDVITEKEVADIDRILKAGQIDARIYTDTIGTESSFKSLSGQNCGIIHIATHGIYGKNEPPRKMPWLMTGDESQYIEDKAMTRSGLLFAGAANAWQKNGTGDDGILTAQEAAMLDLRGLDLCVLSACETGLGEITGEGVFGLQRGFKKAGAKTLLVSLRKVDDNATRLLMTEFYRNYLSGKSKAESLKAAQAHLRNYEPQNNNNSRKETTIAERLSKTRKQATTSIREKPYANPAYWAYFILVDAL